LVEWPDLHWLRLLVVAFEARMILERFISSTGTSPLSFSINILTMPPHPDRKMLPWKVLLHEILYKDDNKYEAYIKTVIETIDILVAEAVKKAVEEERIAIKEKGLTTDTKGNTPVAQKKHSDVLVENFGEQGSLTTGDGFSGTCHSEVCLAALIFMSQLADAGDVPYHAVLGDLSVSMPFVLHSHSSDFYD
jgi:hypothetical protein